MTTPESRKIGPAYGLSLADHLDEPGRDFLF